MKKFLLKVALFFILVAVLDMICGWGFDILRSKARGGQTRKNEYIANECMDDILILGSSKADHHYVPSVFEDSLGLTCYNAGEMGCGIIPAYIRYQMVSNRKKPRLVLYEVTPTYDYLETDSYTHYLGAMRQYADRKDVRKVYLDFSDDLERLRLLSNMYCNNSKVLMNLKDVFAKPDIWKGYEPLNGKINPNKVSKNVADEIITDKPIDSLKYAYFENLIIEANRDEIPLVFVISPSLHGNKKDVDYRPAFEMGHKYNIPIIDNRNCESFVGQSDYYQDGTHLNHVGAVAYSQYVVDQINELMNKRTIMQ